VCHEILCDLKSDSLIGPGDQGDGFVLHNYLRFGVAVWPTAPCRDRLKNGTSFRLYTEQCSVSQAEILAQWRFRE
jgi:hypothetical protein